MKFMSADADMKMLATVQESVDKPFGVTDPALPPRNHLGQTPPPTEQIIEDMVDKLLG